MMKLVVFTSLAFISESLALVASNPTCCFSLTATGNSVSGPVGQLYDGQNRINQTNLPIGHYCISDGMIKDSQGRGCILTPPTTQFQCDTGASPPDGWQIGCDGTVTYDDKPHFWACATGDDGGYNIYTSKSAGGRKSGCVRIGLTAEGCRNCPSSSSIPVYTPSPSSSPSPYQPPSSTPSPPSPSSSASSYPTSTLTSAPTYPATTTLVTFYSSAPAPSSVAVPSSTPAPTPSSISSPSSAPVYSSAPAPSSTPVYASAPVPSSASASVLAPAPSSTPSNCPAALSGPYEFPHLIIPVNASSPNTAYSTSYFGTVSPSISSIFTFDIPYTLQGSTCTLVFLFPEQSQLQTSSYTFSGSGAFVFSELSQPAGQGVTWNTVPAAAMSHALTMMPGNSYAIESFACPAGEQVSFELADVSGSDTYFRYFQDYNGPAIGAYITSC